MSLTSIRNGLSRRIREETSGEDGFTVIEVLVAFTLIAVVTIGTVPLFVAGLRSSLVSKMDTGGKNLNQERFEQMRTLAFHVDVNSSLVPVPGNCVSPTRTDPRDGSGATVCDYRDMLDTYYRSLTPATSTATGGFVASGTARTADEPAIGAFYRYVLDPVPGFSRFKQTVATQFFTSERAPVTPGSAYDSQIAGYDFPPTRFVGVTVITSWAAGNLERKFVAFSQIAEGRPPAAAVTMQARATAIRITSILPGATLPQLKLEAGVSSADGALSSGATAGTAVESAVAEISGGGGRKAGKAGAAGAPPNFNFSDGGANAEQLTDSSGVIVARFGNSDVKDVKANISSEQPIIGDTSDPPNRQATARIRDVGSGLNLGFNNRPDSPSTLPGLLAPDATQMPVFISEPGNTAQLSAASGGTWLKSEAGASHRARAGASASTEFIKIFPTTFAAGGVVQVKLISSSLICSANGTSSSAVADFEAQVKVWTYNPATGTSSYATVVNIASGQLISPLTEALLATQVGADGTTPILLNQYIQSWGSITGAATTSGTSGKTVNRALNGIVSITTHPTRAGVPDSGIGMLIGLLSCIAEDNR